MTYIDGEGESVLTKFEIIGKSFRRSNYQEEEENFPKSIILYVF